MELREQPDLPSRSTKHAFVRAMFDRIAPRYDRLNRLISLGRDQSWRRAILESIALRPGDRVLDLASGTGDLAELARARGASVVALDYSSGMLAAARRRARASHLVCGDAQALPLGDHSIDVITCGFALRNFSDLDRALGECARVLVHGGRLALLEVDEPSSRILRWGHRLHVRHVVPWLGALLSDREAYRYLPASAAYLPTPGELRSKLEKVGFAEVQKRSHLLGAIQAITAVRTVA